MKLVEPGLRPRPIIATPGMVEVLRPGMAGYRMRLPEKVHPISAGVKGGIVGGITMAVPALTYGVLSGHGIWFPVNLLAGAVLPGVDQMTTAELDQFHPLLLSLAIAIHAVTSMIVGLLYGVLLPTLPHFAGGWIVWGGIVIPLLWTGTSHSLMGMANPALAERVDWPWFVASQVVFGVVASIVVRRSQQIHILPAGAPPDRETS